MIEWRFHDYESLPLLALLLLDEGVSINAESLDKAYTAEAADLSKQLLSLEGRSDFLSSVFEAIKNQTLPTREKYASKELNTENSANLLIEPVSFFRWAETQEYELTPHLRISVRKHEDRLRVSNFKDHKITKSEVAKNLNEPLWHFNHAIISLHGYAPPRPYGILDSDDLASQIIFSDKEMRKTHGYLTDAEDTGDIQVYEKKLGLSGKVAKRIKPKEFMKWAASLDIDFPNLLSTEKARMDKNISDNLNPKERESLLKLVIGMAVEQYNYDPHSLRNEATADIATDLATNGVPLDRDTILKWLREGAELLPREPE